MRRRCMVSKDGEVSEPMEWETYEQLTAAIYKALGKRHGVTIDCYGRQCKVTGKSGIQHQIDVLVRHSNGLQDLRTAIECKYWSKKIGKEVVAAFDSCIRDTGIEKGVMVSRLGFTQPAIQLAQHTRIGLVELREPIESDWEGRIKEVSIAINHITPEVYDFEILQDQNSVGPARVEKSNVPPSHITIDDPARGVHTLQDIADTELREGSGEDRQVNICCSPGTTLRMHGEQMVAEITGIRFKIRHHHHFRQVTVSAVDRIFMIMSDLFSKREFTLDHEGNLAERSMLQDCDVSQA